MGAEKKLPTREDLVGAGVSYHLDGNDIYFSSKELKKKYSFVKHHKSDEKTFEVEDKPFTGIKAQNLFI